MRHWSYRIQKIDRHKGKSLVHQWKEIFEGNDSQTPDSALWTADVSDSHAPTSVELHPDGTGKPSAPRESPGSQQEIQIYDLVILCAKAFPADLAYLRPRVRAYTVFYTNPANLEPPLKDEFLAEKNRNFCHIQSFLLSGGGRRSTTQETTAQFCPFGAAGNPWKGSDTSLRHRPGERCHHLSGEFLAKSRCRSSPTCTTSPFKKYTEVELFQE